MKRILAQNGAIRNCEFAVSESSLYADVPRAARLIVPAKRSRKLSVPDTQNGFAAVVHSDGYLAADLE